MSTERTFLSWLEFSIVLGSIAAALLNFSDPSDAALKGPGKFPSGLSQQAMGNDLRTTNGTGSGDPRGHKPINATLISAFAFTLIALVALLYSLGLYLWRVDRINKRMSVNYHDYWGPTGLCIGLFAAMLVSFGFRMFGWGAGTPLKG
jgi:hypothetical protein